MKKIFIVIGLVLLTGCATEAKYKVVLDSWLGHEPLSLIRSWGPPQQTYKAGDYEFLVYMSSSSVTIPGSEPSYKTTFIGNTAYTTAYGGSSATTIPLSCTTTFEVSENHIVNWHHKGNNCVSR